MSVGRVELQPSLGGLEPWGAHGGRHTLLAWWHGLAVSGRPMEAKVAQPGHSERQGDARAGVIQRQLGSHGVLATVAPK